MIPPDSVFLWAWDARPFPAFPDFDVVWADGANWQTGHWLNGRIEGATLDRLVGAILRDFGIEALSEGALDGFVDGYVVDRPMSARAALQPLARLFGVDAAAGGGRLLWRGRGGRAVAALTDEDLVADPKGPSLRLGRAAETELPAEVVLGFTDGEGEYRRAAVASRKLSGGEPSRDGDRRGRRDPARGGAAPRRHLAPGPLGRARDRRVRAHAPRRGARAWRPRLAADARRPAASPPDAPARRADAEGSARAVEPAVFDRPRPAEPRPARRPPPVAGRPEAILLDLPVARGEPTGLQYLAVAADPWPGSVAVWRSADEEDGFALHRVVRAPALVGRTLTALGPGPLWRWDRAATLDVRMGSDGLVSVRDRAALAGRNTFALQGSDGRWELLVAARAELIGPRTFRLSRFLRGLGGSEEEAGRTVPAGRDPRAPRPDRRAARGGLGRPRPAFLVPARPGGAGSRRPDGRGLQPRPPAPPRCARSPPFG